MALAGGGGHAAIPGLPARLLNPSADALPRMLLPPATADRRGGRPRRRVGRPASVGLARRRERPISLDRRIRSLPKFKHAHAGGRPARHWLSAGSRRGSRDFTPAGRHPRRVSGPIAATFRRGRGHTWSYAGECRVRARQGRALRSTATSTRARRPSLRIRHTHSLLVSGWLGGHDQVPLRQARVVGEWCSDRTCGPGGRRCTRCQR